jgi:hypothetical protein
MDMDGWDEHGAGPVADLGQLRNCRLIPDIVQGRSLTVASEI